MRNPKVSIAVPIYGVEKYINRCAVSLFEQTYQNIEYIFVNDKTKDKSISVLHDVISRYNWLEQIRIVEHDRNRGLAGARITGMNHATGDYIMFVDSDDYLEKDAVEIMVNKAEAEKSDVVIAAFNHVYPNNRFIYDAPDVSSYENTLERTLKREIALNVWSRLYKRTLFIKNGISFIEGINMGEDYVVTSRLMYYAKTISFVKKPLYNYVHYNNNSYTSAFKRKNLDEIIHAEKIVRDFYIKIGNPKLIKFHAIGNQKLKAEFLILLLRSEIHNKQDFEYIKNLFIEDENIAENIHFLKIQDRLILKMSQFMPEPFMAFIVRNGFAVKQIIK